MWPLLKTFLHELLFDAAAARRQLRALLLTFATGGIAFGDQVAALVSAPRAVTGIKVASVVAGLLAGAISVGEKNPPTSQP